MDFNAVLAILSESERKYKIGDYISQFRTDEKTPAFNGKNFAVYRIVAFKGSAGYDCAQINLSSMKAFPGMFTSDREIAKKIDPKDIPKQVKDLLDKVPLAE